MNDTMANLEVVSEKIRARLDSKNTAREGALKISREIIRASADAIRAVHRGEFEQAKSLLDTADKKHLVTIESLKNHPTIFFTGYVQDAHKEFAEACITYAIVAREPLPDPDDIAVEGPAYLNGLAEAMGEMRRHSLDLLRRAELDEAERVLQIMDDVYHTLVTFDYPDAVTSGLRRTTDMVRGVLERTRGDLTLVSHQQKLGTVIRDALEKASAFFG